VTSYPSAVRMAIASFAMALASLLHTPACADNREDVGYLGNPAIGIGVGMTFDFWHTTGGVVLPLTFSWDRNRYEIGAFRLASEQKLYEPAKPTEILAEPYWAVTATRRWSLVRRRSWRLFLGLGFAYKSKKDIISASRWDFAETIGARFALPGRRTSVEFSIRHWSNAGISLPNRGQNIAMVSILWGPGAGMTAD
jgi:hypothetical protein